MASLTDEQCRRDFGMGPTLQLDDYPYVHLMHCIDDELQHGWHDVYYHGPSRPFRDNWTWAVLIELLNEDYAHLCRRRRIQRRTRRSDCLTGWMPRTKVRPAAAGDGRCAAPDSQEWRPVWSRGAA